MHCLSVQKSVYMPVCMFVGAGIYLPWHMYGAQRTTSGGSAFSILRKGLLFKYIHQFSRAVSFHCVLGVYVRAAASSFIWVLAVKCRFSHRATSQAHHCVWLLTADENEGKEPHACRKVSVSSCHCLPWHSAPKSKWDSVTTRSPQWDTLNKNLS